MNKKILGIALMLPVLCLTLAFMSGAGKLSVKAEENAPELLTMVEGASIRVAAPHGLRFMAEVNDENALKETQEYGMYFCPTAILKKNWDGVFPSGSEISGLSVPSTGKPTSEKPIVRCVMGGTVLNKDDIDEDNELGKVLRYSIVQIKDSHIDREFSAMAFWKKNDVEHVTAQTSRSISYVARHAKRDPNEPAMKNDAAKAYIEGILNDSNDVLFISGTVKDETYHHSGMFSRKVENVPTTGSLQLKLDRNSEGNTDIDMLVFYAKAENEGVTINDNAVATGDFKKIVIKNPVISAEGTISLPLAGSGALWLDDVKLCKCLINADDESAAGSFKDDWHTATTPVSSSEKYNSGDTKSVCEVLPAKLGSLQLKITKDIDVSGYDSIELSIYYECSIGAKLKNPQDKSYQDLTSGAWTDVSIPLNGATTIKDIKFELLLTGWSDKNEVPTDFYISSVYCTGYVKVEQGGEEPGGTLLLDFETSDNVAKVIPVWHNVDPYVVEGRTFNGKKVIGLTVTGGDDEAYRGNYFKFDNVGVDVTGKEAIEFYIYNPTDIDCLFSFGGLCGHTSEQISLSAGAWTKIRVTIGSCSAIDEANTNEVFHNFGLYLSQNASQHYPRTEFYMSPVYLIEGNTGTGSGE